MKQSHPNCTDTRCQTCLRESLAVGDYLDEATGDSRTDHLGHFHTWLKEREIEPETEHGWATEAMFDDRYIAEYVKHVLDKGGRIE